MFVHVVLINKQYLLNNIYIYYYAKLYFYVGIVDTAIDHNNI